MATHGINGKTKTMSTWQIPNRLKKKLQSSLENLSAKEAGRLYLILIHEARKKKVDHVGEYPAIKELNAAMERQVDKARGKPDEAEAVDRVNGYILLQRIIEQANELALTEYTELGLQSTRSGYVLEHIIREDQLGIAARGIQEYLVEMTPSAISPEEDEAVKRFVSEEGFEELDDIFEYAVVAWTEAQGFKSLHIPHGFLIEYSEIEDKDGPSKLFEVLLNLGKDPDVRRAYIESLDRATIEELFEDDQAVERWILDGESDWTNFTREEEGAKFEEVEAFIEELAQAGRLAIWPAFYLAGTVYSPHPIIDGKIPAWVALREVWSPWLFDQGFQIEEQSAAAEFAPDFISRIYDYEGNEVSFDDVVELAKAFYADCRRRSWGKGLTNPKDIDPEALAKTLLQEESIVLDATAPDFGVADWEALVEEDGVVDSVDRRVVRIKEIREVACELERLGIPVDDFVDNLGMGFKDYYATEDAFSHRQSKKRVVEMLEQLRPDRIPFAFRVKPGEEPVRMVDEFFPVDVSTQLDGETRILREVIRRFETVRQAIAIIADRYFDGIPIVHSELALNREKFVDEMTKATVEMLEGWVKKLWGWPWKVDASPLLIGDIELDPDRIEKFVDVIVENARIASRIDEPEARLFR